MSALTARARAVQLDSYIEHVTDRDILEQGGSIRRPGSLGLATLLGCGDVHDRLLLGDPWCSHCGRLRQPARSTTTQTNRNLLTRIWVLDPVPT
ncbi:hypothetical protein D4740_12455 [Actinomyces sp. 2119]|uniref:Uncharacterized protein n=1 Tax=Actinomyces lilanjuaniae TaxID=2321394 RepID=A0ABN5PMK8_9ACTO|nr:MULTISPECIES: hypothetical protein [Actinomyces]AYD89620.1 hypothetical protein D5R93_05345 [Actinomyces lilanjuaniae]RJF40226.1 hypothetical protein D4740_12455 [Actinomyces sp. 2119]